MSATIGFIGIGQMANAIIRGVIRAGIRQPAHILIFDKNLPKIQAMKELGVRTADSAAEVVRESSLVILAVKPYAMSPLLGQIREHVTTSKTMVSVAAGTTLESISKQLPTGAQVIRVMPNTPCLIGEGVSAIAPGSNAKKENVAAVVEIFSALGLALEMEEKYLDAVTGLSGSGPAFVFTFIEALADGGVRSGLPRDVAMKLAVQVVKGSAAMVEQTKAHPGELKDRVASPGGTTIAGLHALENRSFRAAAMDAVYQATIRSKELSQL